MAVGNAVGAVGVAVDVGGIVPFVVSVDVGVGGIVPLGVSVAVGSGGRVPPLVGMGGSVPPGGMVWPKPTAGASVARASKIRKMGKYLVMYYPTNHLATGFGFSCSGMGAPNAPGGMAGGSFSVII